MRDSLPRNRFELEALELRVLLSAVDPAAPVAGLGICDEPNSAETLFSSEISSTSADASVAYDPASQIEDVFDGLAAAGNSSATDEPNNGSTADDNSSPELAPELAEGEAAELSFPREIESDDSSTGACEVESLSIIDQLTTTLRAANGPPEEASKAMTFTAPAGLMEFRLRVEGDDFQVVDGLAVLATQPVALTQEIMLRGADGQENWIVIDSSVLLESLGITIKVEGGTGEDTLLIDTIGLTDAEWLVTTEGAGTFRNVTFSGMENLVGGADSEDTFVFEAGGFVRGNIEGGDRGFDSIVLNGSYDSIIYTAISPDSGTILLGEHLVTYSGFEPITDNGNVPDRVLGYTAGADRITVQDVVTPNQVMVVADTAESITLNNPANSLRIEGGAGNDTILFNSLFFNTRMILDGGADTDTVDLTGRGLPMSVVRFSDGSAELSDGFDVVRVLNVENFVGASATLFISGIPDWVSQGPGPLQGGQVRGILNQPVTGAVQSVAVDPIDPLKLFIGASGGGVWLNSDRSVHFVFDHDIVLDPAPDPDNPGMLAENQATLDEFVAILLANPGLTVRLVGHTDNVGDAGFNLGLGQRRANNVRDYLTSHGIALARITSATSQGLTNPLATNTTPAGRSLNRRVEMLVNHWTPLTDFLPSLSISAIAIDPSNPNTIYAGTGETSSATALFPNRTVTIGLLKSTNGGRTWEILQRPLFQGQSITDIIITTSGVLMVSTDGGAAAGAGLFRSTDGGANFVDVSTLMAGMPPTVVFPAAPVTDLEVDPGDVNRFYAGMPSRGVFTSPDAGLTWIPINFNQFPNPTDMVDNDNDGATDEADEILPSRIFLTTSATNDPVSGQRPLYAAFISPVRDTMLAAIAASAPSLQVRAGTNLEPGDTVFIQDGVNPREMRVVASVGAVIGMMQTVNLVPLAAGVMSSPHNAGATLLANGQRVWRIYRSPDRGANWVALSRPGTTEANGFVGLNPGRQGNTHFSFMADPLDPQRVYVAGDRQPARPSTIGAVNATGRLFLGTANAPIAAQWAPVTDNGTGDPDGGGPLVAGNAPHADSRSMAFQGVHLLQTDDGGIYRLVNPGVAGRFWESLNHDLTLTEFYDVAYQSVNDVIVGGTQDVGNGLQSGTNAVIWNTISQGDGAYVGVDGTTLFFSAWDPLESTCRHASLSIL